MRIMGSDACHAVFVVFYSFIRRRLQPTAIYRQPYGLSRRKIAFFFRWLASFSLKGCL
jgi:hypothetical protein